MEQMDPRNDAQIEPKPYEVPTVTELGALRDLTGGEAAPAPDGLGIGSL